MFPSAMMPLFAHGEGSGWGGPFEPWEFHPVLIHFPIAFLLGGVAVGLYAAWRRWPELESVATGLLFTGFLFGVLTALSGVLAMYTAPDNTETAERLMPIHLWVQVAAIVLFGLACWGRWRARGRPPGAFTRLLGVVGAVVLIVGSAIGGYMVYHAGAGIESDIMAHDVHEDES